MKIATVKITDTRAKTTWSRDIPQGIVGAKVELEFDDEAWAGLRKDVVLVGAKDVTLMDTGDEIELPPEVVAVPGTVVQIGVIGIGENGTAMIPTIWAELGPVKPAPGGQVGFDPQLPVWAQLQQQVGNLKNLDTETKDNLVAAINELYRRGAPAVKSVGGVEADENGDVPLDWVATYERELTTILEGVVAAGLNKNLTYEMFEGYDDFAIACDNDVFLCEAKFGEEAGDPWVQVGNQAIAGGGEDTGEPFLIWGYKSTKSLMVSFKEPGEHMLNIYGCNFVYNKLPKEYLPGCVVTSVNGVSPDENGNVKVTVSGGSGGGFVAQDTAPTDTSLLWVDTSDGTEDEGDEPEVVIPEKLPNPNALTFTGAVNATYDGSGAVTVTIPAAVTDEHINDLINAALAAIPNAAEVGY